MKKAVFQATSPARQGVWADPYCASRGRTTDEGCLRRCWRLYLLERGFPQPRTRASLTKVGALATLERGACPQAPARGPPPPRARARNIANCGIYNESRRSRCLAE
eukprot:3949772-Prymnesium_polylepis.1